MIRCSELRRTLRGIVFKAWSAKRRDACCDLLGLALLLIGAVFMFLVAIPEAISYQLVTPEGVHIVTPEGLLILVPPDAAHLAERDRYLVGALPAIILILLGTFFQARRPWREFREG